MNLMCDVTLRRKPFSAPEIIIITHPTLQNEYNRNTLTCLGIEVWADL